MDFSLPVIFSSCPPCGFQTCLDSPRNHSLFIPGVWKVGAPGGSDENMHGVRFRNNILGNSVYPAPSQSPLWLHLYQLCFPHSHQVSTCSTIHLHYETPSSPQTTCPASKFESSEVSSSHETNYCISQPKEAQPYTFPSSPRETGFLNKERNLLAALTISNSSPIKLVFKKKK